MARTRTLLMKATSFLLPPMPAVDTLAGWELSAVTAAGSLSLTLRLCCCADRSLLTQHFISSQKFLPLLSSTQNIGFILELICKLKLRF